ncbi:MAG: exopolysaccharide biosynthesis protein [Rhodospirillales bacterium]
MTGTRLSPAYAFATDDARHRQPSAELAALARKVGDRGEVTIDDIVRHFGSDASAGWLLLLLAIPALVPSPGVPLGMIFGTGLAMLALHLTFGPRPVRLPKWIARRRLAASYLDTATARLGPMIQRLERLTRPRLAALVQPSAIRLLGLVVLVNAVLIILPIPLGNTLPAMAVMSLALGLIARDGLAVAAGLGLSVTALAVSAALVSGAVRLAEILMRE